jgi:diaminopimelate epimerase
MTLPVRFTKMHGLGNDFVVIDAISQPIKVDPKLARQIAHRYYGIGCDQVLVIEAPHRKEDDFYYRIFNADGSIAEQCGNGARCIGRFVYEQGLTGKKEILFGIASGQMKVIIEPDAQVTAMLGNPVFNAADIPINALAGASQGRFNLSIDGQKKEVACMSLGNPHCVINVPSTKEAKVVDIGKQLQDSATFPQGINVGFMQVLARNHIKLRVYERGAGETLACGSGASAAVVAGILHGDLGEEVKVDMRGGSVTVAWRQDDSVALTGPCKRLFDGEFAIEQKNG